MDRWVALLRGVNVGGGNRVPMADLRALAADLGWTDVRTHIASGNLVFSAEGEPTALAGALRAGMAARMGVDVPVLVLSGAEVIAACADCPFEPEEGRHVHAYFLWSDPVVDLALLETLRDPSEAFELRGRVAWLHAPEGIGQSKLAERLGRVLTGAEMTGRNLNTLRRLAEMAG